MATSLLAKLQLKPGQKVLLQNTPEDVKGVLSKALSDTTLVARGPAEAVILFVHDLAETKKRTPGAIQALKSGGLLWIAYPKGTGRIKTDVHRDTLAESVLASGWQGIRLIALDETWSVMRFRPAEEVGR